MRSLITTSIFFFAIFCVNAQTIERQVVGAAGGTFSNTNASAEFTVGETATTTLSDGTTTLSQGFHQESIQLEIFIAPAVYLQGAALNPNTGQENLMRDDLRVAGLIPTTSPYADGVTCDASIFNRSGATAIVDWVLVELRDKNDNTLVVRSQSALLQRNGNIIAADGDFVLTFNVGIDNYFVAIQHRNHLGIMTATAVLIDTSNVDFTNANSQITFGSNAQTSSGMPNGIVGMWSGNVNGDTVVQYSGTTPDTPAILSAVLNDSGNFLNFPTFAIADYSNNDVNLDGIIQYSGVSPDTPIILQNVFAHPGNFLNFSTYQIMEQLPENN
ncbi:MAG: hemagglutinin protein [Bacteroidota bacterium]